ncbi:MAG: PDZ domain-containing protein [Oscillospiraceae bacterium]|nr:PDZ domain-containing protein [Oscillospiraceae bacterium]
MKKLMIFMSYVLVAALASAVSFAAAANVPREDNAKLDELRALVDEKFIGEIDWAAAEDSAAAGMVAGLGDRWSYYMSAERYDSYLEQMNNAYVGVGITVTEREDGYIDVVEVVRGGPAERAGIEAGDVLTHADGVDLATLTMDETTGIIKGEEGTTVQLTIRREEITLEMDVKREFFEVTVASGQMLTEDIGMVTIENFDGRCADETIDAIESLMDQGAKKLIFDVRNNPGGYKRELCAVLDYLLPEGPLFRSEYYDGTEQVDESDADCLDIPMAVLVNSESISAAEFFAAALDEYEAATVVGTQTIGKGYFQQTYRLSDGSAVGLSVGKYTTPNGVSLTDVGITPDVVVEVDEELFWQIYYGNVEWTEDPQVLAAVEVLETAE